MAQEKQMAAKHSYKDKECQEGTHLGKVCVFFSLQCRKNRKEFYHENGQIRQKKKKDNRCCTFNIREPFMERMWKQSGAGYIRQSDTVGQAGRNYPDLREW